MLPHLMKLLIQSNFLKIVSVYTSRVVDNIRIILVYIKYMIINIKIC